MWAFSFDVNPVSASRPRVTRAGHTYYAGPYKQFRKDMEAMIEERVVDFDPLLSPLCVQVDCFVTKPKKTKLWTPRADVDNYAKAVLDSFNGVLWDDDRQIVELHVNKSWTESWEHPGHIDITITEENINYEQDDDGTWRHIRYGS